VEDFTDGLVSLIGSIQEEIPWLREFPVPTDHAAVSFFVA
jgi:hypothetical protein